MESYWSELCTKGKTYDQAKFKQAESMARRFGFIYQTTEEIATGQLEKILDRTQVVTPNIKSKKAVEAILIGINIPDIILFYCLKLLLSLIKNGIVNKYSNQIRKWRNPRIRSVKNFLKVIGNKALTDLHRNDIIQFRDWYINRVENNRLKPKTVNKSLVHLKTILEIICDHYQLAIDLNWLFKKTKLKTSSLTHRPPFTTQFIQSHILKPQFLEQLNPEARAILIQLSETGARPNEICGLNPEDIHSEHEIPHIAISPRKGHELKTVYNKRSIPILGKALHEISNFQEESNRHNGKAVSLSVTLNKYLKTNDLLPTSEHCLYSL